MYVRAVAKQFQWDFQYPGPDGQFDTADDKVILHELHVPADKVVVVLLRGKDVIHSFFIPVFRLKQDALPGREIRAWFQATKTGKWEIPCAELCGPGHSGMKGIVHGVFRGRLPELGEKDLAILVSETLGSVLYSVCGIEKRGSHE